MIAFRFVLIFVGITLAIFGFFIYFKGKYNLINNFEVDKKNLKYDDRYAKRVGSIEFFGGLIISVLGALMFFANDFVSVIVFCVSIVGIIMSLLINGFASVKKNRVIADFDVRPPRPCGS